MTTAHRLGPADGPLTAPTAIRRPYAVPHVASAPATRSLAAALIAVDLITPALVVLQTPVRAPAMMAFAIGFITIMGWLDLYRRRFHESLIDDLAVIGLATTAGIGLACMAGLRLGRDALPDLSTFAFTTVAIVSVGRVALYSIERRRRRSGRHGERAVIVGSGETSVELLRRIDEHPELGIQTVGVVGEASAHLPVPVLGRTTELSRVVEDHRISTVIIALPQTSEADLVHMLRGRSGRELDIYTVPPCFTMVSRLAPGSDRIWGIPVNRLSTSPLERGHYPLKRVLDVVVSFIALVVLSPLLLVVAFAVRMEVGRGVLFRQVRVGQGFEPITVIKFRSMRTVSEADSDTTWSVAQDRIGPVGRFIRASSIDELPQLINVLRGDMSLVGPRPERPHFVDQYQDDIPTYQHRHRMRMGVTGYAAVHGLRGDTSIEDRAYFDNIYIDNWSLWLDVKIILRTLVSVVGRHGG